MRIGTFCQNNHFYSYLLPEGRAFNSKRGILFLFIFSVIQAACRPISPSSTKAIVGDDHRHSISFSDPVANAVGFFMTPTGPCTAFVSGDREITTASHCFDPLTKDLRAYLFVLAGTEKEAHVIEYLEDQSNAMESRLRVDVSFDKSIEVAAFDAQKPLTILSFDPDQAQLVTDQQCSGLFDETQSFLLHDCDSLPGASGSPLVQDGKVVAVHQGYSESLGKNTAYIVNTRNLSEVSFAEIIRQTDHMELSCNTNCSDHCKRKIRGLWVPNPFCEAACHTERGIDCILKSVRTHVITEVLKDIEDEAIRQGWTKAACVTVGTPPILLASSVYIAPACSAAGAATVGWGVPACVTAISGAIVTGVCTQLCNDQHLLDCKQE